MVKIIGNKAEVDDMVNFIENNTSQTIEVLSYNGFNSCRDQYIKDDTEITENIGTIIDKKHKLWQIKIEKEKLAKRLVS